MRQRLASVGAALFALVAAGPSTAAALPVDKGPPLVFKALPSTRSVLKANPTNLPNPPKAHLPNPPKEIPKETSKETELFKQFREWLRTQRR
jgi:hypothetical protein